MACVFSKSLQSCLTLCDPMDHSLPGSSVHGILHAKILKWVAMLPSRGIFPTQGSEPCLYVSCIGRQVLYHYCATREAPNLVANILKNESSQVALVVKNPLANTGNMGDMDLISGSGRFPGGGHATHSQYSCLRITWTECLAGYSTEHHKASDNTEVT